VPVLGVLKVQVGARGAGAHSLRSSVLRC